MTKNLLPFMFSLIMLPCYSMEELFMATPPIRSEEVVPLYDGRTCGWLTVISGPMFSGKTAELIRRINLARMMWRVIDVFKPKTDTRFVDAVVSRNGCKISGAYSVNSNTPQDIIEILARIEPKCVFIDEVQFFNGEIVGVVEDLLNTGVNVVAAGLDRDFKREPFGDSMPQLLSRADECVKLKAVCSSCRRYNATFTQRLINGSPAKRSSPLVVVDDLHSRVADISYEPRCRACHELPE
jgi:thymidine kinase